MMDYTDLIDPNNSRTGNVRDYVNRMRLMMAEIDRLEARRRTEGKLATPETLMLARAYFGMGRTMEAAQLVRPLIDEVNEPAVLQAISTILVSAGLDGDAERCLSKYLRLEPSKDALAWLDLAKIQHRTGRKTLAQRSFLAAYNIDMQGVFNLLQKDQNLYEIALPLFQKRK